MSRPGKNGATGAHGKPSGAGPGAPLSPALSPRSAGGEGQGEGGRPTDKDRKRLEAEARNARYRLEKPLRDAIQATETRIAELERVEREATAALADPAVYDDFSRARVHVEAQKRAQAELATLYGEWERLSGELEGLA